MVGWTARSLAAAAVYCWYSESQQYGEKSIMYRTYNDFSQLLQDHTATKYLPGILVTSSECCKVRRQAGRHPPPLSRMMRRRPTGWPASPDGGLTGA